DGALTAVAMAERVRWQLDGWLSSGATTAGLTLLRLAPDEVHPDDGHQLGFWGSPAADERVARALARVQGLLGHEAVTLAVAGDRWTDVVSWAGPWPVEERWWDTRARRRRARWQVATADGAAHLLCLEDGRWSVEATYD